METDYRALARNYADALAAISSYGRRYRGGPPLALASMADEALARGEGGPRRLPNDDLKTTNVRPCEYCGGARCKSCGYTGRHRIDLVADALRDLWKTSRDRVEASGPSLDAEVAIVAEVLGADEGVLTGADIDDLYRAEIENVDIDHTAVLIVEAFDRRTA